MYKDDFVRRGQPNFTKILSYVPGAFSNIRGSKDYPHILGSVKFYQTSFGVIVNAQISGLPTAQDLCSSSIFAFHIHEGTDCSGNNTDPFANARTHYNPYDCPHPYHAGDLPPLFSANGIAFSSFLTNRFTLAEIIGKTVIIHSSIDDFSSQPSGNAGEKIACGIILPTKR